MFKIRLQIEGRIKESLIILVPYKRIHKVQVSGLSVAYFSPSLKCRSALYPYKRKQKPPGFLFVKSIWNLFF